MYRACRLSAQSPASADWIVDESVVFISEGKLSNERSATDQSGEIERVIGICKGDLLENLTSKQLETIVPTKMFGDHTGRNVVIKLSFF